jgi:hypothetical protein
MMATNRKRNLRRIALLGGWLAGLLGCATWRVGGEDAIRVGVAPATKRVWRNETITNWPREIRLSAARNESEPFQVAVQAGAGNLRGINAAVTDLVGTNPAQVIPARDIELFREYFLFVIQPSGYFEWMPVAEYPGPMLPFNDPYATNRAPYGAPFDNLRIGSPAKPFRDVVEAGPGSVFPCGEYTGRTDRRYVIQIEKGGKAGEATFRWSDSWIGGLDGAVKVERWNGAQALIPAFQPGGRTPPVPLNDGVAVQFAYGQRGPKQNDFEAGHTYHFNCYAAMNEVIWGDIRVRPETPPGEYRGTLTISAQDRREQRLPIVLTVRNFMLPRTNSVATAFAWPMGAGSFSNAPQIGKLYELLRHQHKLDDQKIPGAAVGGGPGHYDWSAFDKVAPAFLDGSYYPDGVPQNRFHLGLYGCGNDWQFQGMAGGDTNRLAAIARELAAHLKEKGWMDRVYVYCHDEPVERHYPAIIRDIQAFRQGDPAWAGKFMVTAHPDAAPVMIPWIDIWCPIYSRPIKPETYRQLAERGSKLWAYTCCAPHSPVATYHVDTIKGYEPRIIKWACWKMKAEGFLYWAMCLDRVYPNPWLTAMTGWRANGDGTFFFAGARNGPGISDNATPLRPIMGPLADFRIKQVREGLEDWEYLLLCEKIMGREFVEQIVAEVYREAPKEGRPLTEAELERYWTQDDTRIYTAREKLATAIEKKP